MKHLFSLWFIFVPLLVRGITIEGRLLHRFTLEPIKHGTIVLKASNQIPLIAYSDERGYFVFEDIPQEKILIETKVTGFYSEKATLFPKEKVFLPLYLTPLPTASGGEIEVTAERQRATAKTTVHRTDIQKATSSLTSDPVDTLKQMPGVESISSSDMGTGSKLSVRGGEGFETAADLDGLFLRSFFHRGIIPDSLFIDDMLEEMVLYKGVAPVEYGQILSGFLSVRQINPPVGFHGKLHTGLLSTYLTLYGKTEDDTWQWANGIRRTYYDLVLPLFFQETTDTRNIQIPYYLDSHGKIQYQHNADKVLFSYLISLEPGYFTNLEPGNEIKGGFLYRYLGCNLEWTHSVSSNIVIEQSLNLLQNDNTGGLEFQTNVTSRLEDRWLFLRYRLMPRFFLSENLSLFGGGEVMFYPVISYSNVMRGLYTNIITLQVEYTNFAETVASTNTAFFAGFGGIEWTLFEKRLVLLPGIRINSFPVANRFSLDPRFNAEWRFSKESKLFVGIGHLSQWPTEPFIFAFYTTNEEKRNIPGVWHATLGGQWLLSEVWEINTEAYVKHYENPVSRVSNIQMEFQSGGMKKEIAGIELFVRKLKGGFPLYGWISGSFRNEWYYLEEGTDPNSFAGVSISADENGNIQSSVASAWQYARAPLHTWFSIPAYRANLTAIWDFARHWSLTAEFQYESRGYITPIEGGEAVTIGTNTIYIPKYGSFLSEKLPDRHQLNLKIEWTPTWWGLPWGLYIQIMNIYNYRQVYYSYTDDYSSRKTNLSPIGIYGYGGIWVRW